MANKITVRIANAGFVDGLTSSQEEELVRSMAVSIIENMPINHLQQLFKVTRFESKWADDVELVTHVVELTFETK